MRFEFHYIQPAAMKVSGYGKDGRKEELSFNNIEYNEAIEDMLKEPEKVTIT